jgi:PPK2 family polyphosphate:nucleotide phosphotransferase
VDLSRKLRIEPGKRVRLGRYDPDATPGYKSKELSQGALERNLEHLRDLQYLMYAENKHALLVVLQGMDAAGKDGTIRNVMSGLNPQGVDVTPFKAPSTEELDHDYLWRIHRNVPPRGDIGIFNRSHYEDLLIVRVHGLVAKSVWSRRYDQINAFEKTLVENNVRVLKFFLHISRDEQKKRIQERIDDPNRRWKLAPSDFTERKFFGAYQDAYEDVLTRCSTPWAPWYIIPANRKWYRNAAVLQVIVDTLAGLKMKFPPPTIDLRKYKLE